MASLIHSSDFGLCGDRPSPVAAWLGRCARRLSGALEAQRRKEADQVIGRLLAESGGRLTDSLEREILHRAFACDWSLPN